MGSKLCCATKTEYDTTPDPDTGLSEKDRALISKSWNRVLKSDSLTAIGVILLTQLVMSYPYVTEYFSKKGKDVNDSEQLSAHSFILMNAIKSFVDYLDDKEALRYSMTRIVETHSMMGISVKQFQDFNQVFKEFLREMLYKKHQKHKRDVIEAWLTLLKALPKLAEENELAEAKLVTC